MILAWVIRSDGPRPKASLKYLGGATRNAAVHGAIFIFPHLGGPIEYEKTVLLLLA